MYKKGGLGVDCVMMGKVSLRFFLPFLYGDRHRGPWGVPLPKPSDRDRNEGTADRNVNTGKVTTEEGV